MKISREYTIHTFDNGIRWVHMENPHSAVAHCGIMLDIGSRDEKPHQLGLAHFWEHMAFKGTKTKKSSIILNRIDSLGGELNAYTTKEKICFHASILSKHIDVAIELLTDITFNSIFPEKEIEKERHVIIEEMGMYADNPEDSIMDEFDALVFRNNPMGNNILGTKPSVTSFTQNHFFEFLNENLSTNKIVFSSVSNIPAKTLLPKIKRYLELIPKTEKAMQRSAIFDENAESRKFAKKIQQAHCMLGRRAYKLTDDNRLPFFMLVNILGGQAMNAWLNMSIREKYGYAYHVDAHYTPFTDTGLFNVYLGTDKKNIQKSIDLVHKEFKRMREFNISPSKLTAYKEQLKGQMAMAEENKNGLMLLMAKITLDIGHIETLEQIFDKVDKLSGTHLKEIATSMLKEEDMNYLIFEPEM
ncbi:MAG: pitrilysin family protein [Bacteroidota bacterium]|nr:pitrilysin family protein [Bacteroidota bacterium]